MATVTQNQEVLTGANVSSVPNRSPFRYPGGKTWLVEQVRDWLAVKGGRSVELVEPFAGGAIVSLTAVAEQLTGSAVLVEKDERVRDVWRAILGRSGRKLAEQVEEFEFSPTKLRTKLSEEGENIRERAFRTLLTNRVRRNGIIAESGGMLKNGENGGGVGSRWYPQTLGKRIREIVSLRDRIEVSSHTTGLRYMRSRENDDDTIFFIDPPYPEVGKRLYRHSDVRAEQVFECAASLSGDFLLTYKNTEKIRALARKHDFESRPIRMWSGHNATQTELLIGKSLAWTAV
jgi:DNA adenine methylase